MHSLTPQFLAGLRFGTEQAAMLRAIGEFRAGRSFSTGRHRKFSKGCWRSPRSNPVSPQTVWKVSTCLRTASGDSSYTKPSRAIVRNRKLRDTAMPWR